MNQFESSFGLVADRMLNEAEMLRTIERRRAQEVHQQQLEAQLGAGSMPGTVEFVSTQAR